MDIETIRNNLFKQDNRATANPVYVVFEWKKYHADPRYTDTWEYGDHSDGYNKIGDPGDRDKLVEFAKDNNLELPQDWVK